MHETGIALEVFRSALESARAEAGQQVRLKSIRVSIGDRSAVDPNLLEHAWQSIVIGTRHDGAELKVKWCPSRRYCPRCHKTKDSSLGSWLPICPDCGDAIEIDGGLELDLDLVEFDVASPLTKRPNFSRTDHNKNV
ncbi:MAG: hydrogenase maturation nickel metallochaperone HypA [Planctomycetes bacterium]|nr:hydrogenase maturation nickel metallochaperone HypA [Planctomycetota bacterium]